MMAIFIKTHLNGILVILAICKEEFNFRPENFSELIVDEFRLPKEFVYLISIGIRKRIKDYVFGLFDHFTKIFTNLKEDNYEKNLKKDVNKPGLSIFQTISTTKPFYDKKDNELKNFVPFMFDVKLENALGPIKVAKTYKDKKLHKPEFLRNRSKFNKKSVNNSHILAYDDQNIIISKKVMKYYMDYDRIVIEKSRLSLN